MNISMIFIVQFLFKYNIYKMKKKTEKTNLSLLDKLTKEAATIITRTATITTTPQMYVTNQV